MSIALCIILISVLIVYGLKAAGNALKGTIEWFVGLFKR